MGTVATNPVTIEEFDKLRLSGDRHWELRGGEVVEVSLPELIHRRLQQRVSDLLRQSFPEADVLVEYTYQIEETNDKRSADVGMTTQERGRVANENKALAGAPDLVAEILSPSNSVAELKQLRRLCFAHGTLVFLVVDPNDSTIEVYLKHEKSPRILTVEDQLTLSLFGEEKTIPVVAIFAGITATES